MQAQQSITLPKAGLVTSQAATGPTPAKLTFHAMEARYTLTKHEETLAKNEFIKSGG